MKEWFLALNQRERVMVGGGAIVVLIMLLYVMVWSPIMKGAVEQEAAVARAGKLLVWMKKSIADAKLMEGAGGQAGGLRPGQSLLSLIDSTAKSSGFGPQVKRVKPDGENKVQIWIDDVPFDQLVQWLESLQQVYGVHVTSTTIDRGNFEGKVNANLQLEGS